MVRSLQWLLFKRFNYSFHLVQIKHSGSGGKETVFLYFSFRIDKARALLMYPWFVPLQIVKDFTSVNPSPVDNNVWVTCFDVKEGESIALYAGDSEGSLLEFKAPDNWRT